MKRMSQAFNNCLTHIKKEEELYMYQKKRKSLITMILTLTLVMGCLTGCGGGGSKGDGQSADAGGSDKKPVTLEIIRWGGGLPAQDDDIIKAEILKRLNVNIELVGYDDISDYINTVNTRIATGDYPDMFWVNQDLLRNYSKKGLVMDLTDVYQNELSTVKDWLGDSLDMGVVDGKTYGIPVPISFEYCMSFIREDWLNHLGLSIPTNLDELYDVAVAFTNDDPDGNGKNDTFALTGNNGLRAFSAIFGAYGVALPTNSGALPSIYVKDGNLVSTVTDPDIKDAILEAKKFVDAGVIDPELFGNTGSQPVQDKAFQGKVGMTRIEWSLFAKDIHIEQAKAVNPDASWKPMGTIGGGNGKELDGEWQIGTPVHMFAIPATLSQSPEKKEALFKVLNYLSTEEGNRLVAYGPEGTYHQVNADGEVELINNDLWKKSDLQAYLYNYQFTGRGDESKYLIIRNPMSRDVIEFAAAQPRIKCLNGFVDFPEGFVASDAATFAEEELIKFIYGRRPIEEYDEFVKTLKEVYSYQSYLDAAGETLQSMGYIK